MSYNKLQLDDIRVISKEIVLNQKVTYLDLSHTQINNEMAKVLSEAIGWNDTLNYINLKGNNFDTKMIHEAVMMNNNINTLMLEPNDRYVESLLYENKKQQKLAKERSEKIKRGKMIVNNNFIFH